MTYFNKGSLSSQAIFMSILLFRIYHIFKDFSCTLLYITMYIFELPLERYTIHLKLRELEVPSTKIPFKAFGKSKSRPTEKMRIWSLLVSQSR